MYFCFQIPISFNFEAFFDGCAIMLCGLIFVLQSFNFAHLVVFVKPGHYCGTKLANMFAIQNKYI